MDVNITSCFQANVTEMRRRAVRFEFNLLDISTATQMSDFFLYYSDSDFYIPVGFYGIFRVCVIATIVGNDIIEGDEDIFYEVVPLSEGVSVEPSAPLRIEILDNDGKYRLEYLQVSELPFT